MSRTTGIMDREIKNNISIRRQIMGDLDKYITEVVNIPSGPNAPYEVADFNRGMIRAVAADASVGGRTTARRAATALMETDSTGAATALMEAGNTGMTPSDEWYRRRLAALTVEAVEGIFAETVLDRMTTLRRLGKLPRDGLAVAVDCHLIPRYDRIKDDHLTISRYKCGTKHFERYITIHCVNDGLRLVLGCLPVPAGASVPKMVRSLIDQCMEDCIVIKLCLFDREFFTVRTIAALNEMNIPFLMPCRNSPGVVETLNLFDQDDPPKDAIPCILKGADGTAPYNMVVAARRKRDPGKSESKAPEDRFIGFATNLPWVDVIVYAVRWGIESAYAQIEAMRAKTRSRNPGARLFCFIYSLMIFNAWVMAKILMRLLISERSLPRRLGTITQLTFKEIIEVLADGPGPPPGGASNPG